MRSPMPQRHLEKAFLDSGLSRDDWVRESASGPQPGVPSPWVVPESSPAPHTLGTVWQEKGESSFLDQEAA
jgi:hypothetical protein